MVFGSVWKSPAPSKMVGFFWQLLLDRIPTKINLARRKILPLDESERCVFCAEEGALVQKSLINSYILNGLVST